MTTRVLVVDDSGFIRRRITQILSVEPGIEVVGMASNGKEAISKTAQLHPDVITMDVEMPIMDGIMAVKEIMLRTPCPILMFSSSTKAGAKSTLDALGAGAIDFLPKELDLIDHNREKAEDLLRLRVKEIARKEGRQREKESALGKSQQKPEITKKPDKPRRVSNFRPQLVVIAASTGGPMAIQKVLAELPANFPLPVLLVQHMPANFTPSFAERLDRLCCIDVMEAEAGSRLKPGMALLAPGGKQMTLKKVGGLVSVEIRDSHSCENYQPCVDTTLESVAKVFPGKVLTVVLTGMGADGREGSRQLKSGGSTIWAQDEQSCTVYGMPKAVADAGLVDQVVALDDIGKALANLNG